MSKNTQTVSDDDVKTGEMCGKELHFILRNAGITHVQYGRKVGRTDRTIGNWYNSSRIANVNVRALEEMTGKDHFIALRKKWLAVMEGIE